MSRVRPTVRLPMAGSAKKPGAMIRRIHGAARMPATVSVPRSSSISPVTARSICRLSARERLVAYSVNTGMNAAETRALGDQPAQEIREPERHEEGVRAGPGPEATGDHQIPQKARGCG